MAKKVGARVLLDACQSVPHMKVDVQVRIPNSTAAARPCRAPRPDRRRSVPTIAVRLHFGPHPSHAQPCSTNAAMPGSDPQCRCCQRSSLAQTLGVDWIVVSAHKMCGPTGVGFLWGSAEVLESMPPWMGGGEMIQDVFLDHSTYALPPARFEAGTPAIAEAIGARSTPRPAQQPSGLMLPTRWWRAREGFIVQ